MSSEMKRVENERRTDAAAILRQLALGIDPQSGRLLDAGHVALRPVNMQALLLAVESLGPRAMAAKIVTSSEKTGASWGTQEDLELRDLFEDEALLSNTATPTEPMNGGTASRLVHLGLVESRH